MKTTQQRLGIVTQRTQQTRKQLKNLANADHNLDIKLCDKLEQNPIEIYF